MKKALLTILILISLCINPQITIPVGAENPSGGIIDGDSIYWENNWGRLEVYPHTAWGEIHQEQYCNATWKLSANDLDIAFRFNDSLIDAHVYEWTGSEWNEVTSAFKHTTYNNKHYYYVENVHFEQDETRRFKWNYDVPFNSTGKWDFMAKLSSESIQYALDNNRYVMLDPWWDTNWLYHRVCSVNHNLIDTDLLNFPVLVRIPSAVTAKCQSNGEDIRFIATAMTGTDNITELYYDIEDWNSSGESLVWVNVTNIQSDIDTTFLMYYGYAGAINNESPYTWNGNYVTVMHLNDTHDSTINYNNGSIRNTDANISGRVGTGKNFTDMDIEVPHSDSLNLHYNFTIETWLKFTDLSSDIYFHAKITGATYHYDSVFSAANEFIRFQPSSGTTDTAANSIASTEPWYYFVSTRERNVDLRNYINGTRSGTAGADNNLYLDTSDPMYVGSRGSAGNPLYMDEFRMSNILRNTSWLNATYHSIVTPSLFVAIGGEVEAPVTPAIVYINATTNISRYNATLNAYVPDSPYFDTDYTGGFWVGTNNPPTDANTNVTYGSITLDGGIHFENGTGAILSENTDYYVKSWIYNATNFVESDNVESFTTLQSPQAPTNVVGNVLGNSSLEITWNIGIAADKTAIIRKVGSFPSDTTDGTEVFNASDEDHYEGDLSGNYRYRIWSWNDTYGEYSSDYADIEYGALIINCYDEDTLEGLTFDVFVSNQDGTETYNTSYATNPHIIDVDLCPLGNQISIEISASDNYSSQSESFYYDLNENETITYVVLALEPDSKSSTNVSCINMGANTEMFPPFTLDGDLITILADAADQFDKIIVNYTHNQYNSMIFYRDLAANNIYTIDAYLPIADETNPYVIQIENEYEETVEGARVIFKKYINSTVGWANLSILYTGATGQCSINLLPNEQYKLNISKSGYVTNTTDYYPDPDYYGVYYPAIFLLKFEEPDIEPGTPGEYITLNATMYTNETIHICFLDKANSTTDVYFEVYEIYNNTRTLKGTFSSTTDDSFCFWVTVTNTSRLHVVEMDCNHSIFGSVLNFPIHIAPLYDNRTQADDLETKISNVAGDFDFGYVITLFLYVPCIIPILIFGYVNHPGYGVLIAGGYAAIVTRYIEFGATDTGKIAILASLLLVLGVLSMAINYYRGHR